MTESARVGKLAELIKSVLAEALEKKVKDPRLGFVTITDVRVTNDLQHATVFYTVFGEESERAETAAALSSASGMLRTEVGRNISLRLTPSLEFVPDAIPDQAGRLEDIISQVKTRDAELAEQSQGAQYAGGDNPYKTADDADDEPKR